jgi:HAD superfamily hydrolase (TIGR01509 family)
MFPFTASNIPVKGLVFDLRDVLFKWSRNTETAISSDTMKKILLSPHWYDYECGRISRSLCYSRVAREFLLDVYQVAEAFSQARASLKPDTAVLAFLNELREKSSVKVYAMSNVAKEDFAALSDKMDFSLFDRVFTSGAHGMRKRDLKFYRQVLAEIELDPEQVIFVDDKSENVLAANGVGMRGLVFNDSTIYDLQNTLLSPVARGHEFLHRRNKNFDSITDSGVTVGDNFAKLLIVEATQDL